VLVFGLTYVRTPGQVAVPLREDANDGDESQGQRIKEEPGTVGASRTAQAQVMIWGRDIRKRMKTVIHSLPLAYF
jgi:hypothetical protein